MNKKVREIIKDSELLKDYLYELEAYNKRTQKPRKQNKR